MHEYHVATMMNEMISYISNYCGWISKGIIQIKQESLRTLGYNGPKPPL